MHGPAPGTASGPGKKAGPMSGRFDNYRFAIRCLCTRFSEMNLVTNYSLEFGVMMRAVCPTVSGLDG
jgi:hypothetical protein